jgi:hypothetical protein
MLSANSAQNGEARVASKSNLSRKKTKFYISVFTLSEREINKTTLIVHAPKK